MSDPILTQTEARARHLQPLTRADDRDGKFIQNVVRDMRRVPGTLWAMVKPETRLAKDSPNMVEIWRVMIPLPD